MKDAEWIAQLLRHGLLKASFIPNRYQRELRELVRYRRSIIEERARGEEIKSGSNYSEGLDDWLNVHKGQGVEMLEPASHAIARVKSESELRELWEETGDSSEWMEIVENLEARLKSLL
ncbi:hypothetical protein Back11_15950 [Paenibacillus baekrokdamisoli]|uniref:Transposase IS110-like N-terminal domain-containing protein n=1 Tax=Paenibacillus baekrokdamisoli TaxID=1712516 RepID=A0A3G9IN30_9BACL|nr:hypothetical protein Back11_15950 [Paenibacillus baekrokdamisoli]